MDHLQLSTDITKRCVDVECVYKATQDDYPPFAKYPGIMGWTDADVRFPGNWSADPRWDDPQFTTMKRKPKIEAEQLLQGWLYFGLLRTFFDETVTPLFQQRYDDIPGKVFVSTRFLPQLLALQRHHYRNAAPERLKALLQLQVYCLLVANKILTVVYQDHSRIDSGIVFSIAVLGHKLESFVSRQQFNRRMDIPDFTSSLTVNSWPLGSIRTEDFVTERLRLKGWCANEIRRINRLAPGSRYLVSQMERPHPEITHGKPCTDIRCTAYNLDKSNYSTNHICETQNCGELTADGKDLWRILSANRVPVVLLQHKSGSDRPVLRVLDADECDDFVAFSHVWSDKLGNPHANAMPICQLLRLSELASKLFCTATFSIPFWIDTLCCPVQPKEAKKAAIRLMRRTYSEASKVLVLEQYIYRCCAADLSLLERFLRIYCSTWLTRLWTLQEGILAKTLYVQFQDTAINFVDELRILLESHDQNSEVSGGLSDLLSEYAVRKLSQTSSNPYLLSIARVQRYLFYRQTSCPEDEPLCLGTLLDQDVATLFEGDLKSRMRRFWKMQTAIPSELIFLRRGPRFTDSGLRWAPQTFMVPENDVLIGVREAADEQNCAQRDEGIIVTYFGYFLPHNHDSGIIAPYFHIKTQQTTPKKQYFVKVDHWIYPRDKGMVQIGADCLQESVQIPIRTEDQRESYQFALVVRAPLEELESSLQSQMGGVHVALVAVYRHEENMLFATLLTGGLVTLEARGRELWPVRQARVPVATVDDQSGPLRFENHEGDLQAFEVEEWMSNQIWCIS